MIKKNEITATKPQLSYSLIQQLLCKYYINKA